MFLLFQELEIKIWNKNDLIDPKLVLSNTIESRLFWNNYCIKMDILASHWQATWPKPILIQKAFIGYVSSSMLDPEIVEIFAYPFLWSVSLWIHSIQMRYYAINFY